MRAVPSSGVRFAPILVLVGALALAGCGSDPASSFGSTVAALKAVQSDPCNGAILETTGHSGANAVSFTPGTLAFVVPASVAVIEGRAEDGDYFGLVIA